MLTLNRVLVKPYKKESLRAKEKNGLALNVGQKVNLTGLVAVAEASLIFGDKELVIKKGQKVYVREEQLHNGTIGTKPMSCDDISEEFMIIEARDLVGIG